METTATIEIKKEIEMVFEYTILEIVEWSSIVVSDEFFTPGPVGVGSRFKTIVEERGKVMEFQGEVTHHSPPARHAVIMRGDNFDLEVDYRFRPKNGGTELTQISRVTPKGGMKIFFFLFGWLMKRGGCQAAMKELQNLKNLLEGGAGAVNPAN